jgi:hypothetical protein
MHQKQAVAKRKEESHASFLLLTEGAWHERLWMPPPRSSVPSVGSQLRPPSFPPLPLISSGDLPDLT